MLEVTPDRIVRAREFLLRKWQERAKEYGRATLPRDLSNACLFCAAFAREVFGAKIYASWHHAWNILPDGTRLDLTQGCAQEIEYANDGIDRWRIDYRYMRSSDFKECLNFNKDRVARWVSEFQELEGVK